MGALLLLPFFLIRFGLLSRLAPTAIKRAAHFAPMKKEERPAYWVYQLSTAALLLCPFFLQIRLRPSVLFGISLIVYLAGNLLLVLSMLNFASPSVNGFNQKRLYRFSRNPMYIAYFVYFFGCVLLTQSFLLLSVLLLFQVSAHWIILAEERWCIQNFGKAYLDYQKRVRRYF